MRNRHLDELENLSFGEKIKKIIELEEQGKLSVSKELTPEEFALQETIDKLCIDLENKSLKIEKEDDRTFIRDKEGSRIVI